jgi:hypothetical protein
LDGLDAGSTNPLEKIKFLVYQRRLLLEALKTKAMIMALVDQKEAAAKTAEAYLLMAMPESKMATYLREQKALNKDQEVQDLEHMAPFQYQPPALKTRPLVAKPAAPVQRALLKPKPVPDTRQSRPK